MKNVYFIFFGFISIISFHCQKEISYSNRNGNQNPFFMSVALQGNIFDENGQPASDVTIRVGNKITSTNAHGYFRIMNASIDKKASSVIAEKNGYFKAYRTFIATSGVNQVMIKLVKKSFSGSINSSAGGDIVLSNGSKIFLPANGITKASGDRYNGTINVYTSYIDPTSQDITQTIPGSFIADDISNKRIILTSYGMLAVELETSAGEKLQIASGNKATLTIAIPLSIRSSAPASISLWYINEQTGIWKEEGTAIKNGNNYVGEVKHFSFWNCDLGNPAVTLSMTLQTHEGSPLVYTEVRLTRSNGYQSYGWTDSLGQVSGLVPLDESLLMEVLAYPCNDVIYFKNIGPFNQDSDLGSITVNNNSSLVTITGQLLNCNNSPVINGYAIIYYNNTVRYASADNTGKFSTNLVICNGSPATCQVLGVDNSLQQQGDVTDINIVVPETMVGNISACGSSSEQYINYTLDGANYSITSSVNDSLFGVTDLVQANPPNYTNIWGIHGSDYVDFGYLHNNTVGTFPLWNLNMEKYDSVTTLIQPFNITVTGYPQNIGEFYEGSFSGQFKHYSTGAVVHKIDCSFRVRRQL
jgi:hypothetical protein